MHQSRNPLFSKVEIGEERAAKGASEKGVGRKGLRRGVSVLNLGCAEDERQTVNDSRQPIEGPSSVIALAGRRIDKPGTEPPRFPLQNVSIVRQRLTGLFSLEKAEALVCSAACGADLIALEEAAKLGLRCRIVLPFSPERFRETSVADRPGEWGPIYDRLVSRSEATGDLVILSAPELENNAAYAAANKLIIRETEALVQKKGLNTRRLVVIVWEGLAREEADASGDLRTLAVQAGFEERIVLTD